MVTPEQDSLLTKMTECVVANITERPIEPHFERVAREMELDDKLAGDITADDLITHYFHFRRDGLVTRREDDNPRELPQ